MEVLAAWGVFALSAAVIVYAGTRLTRYGDRIADLTGPGGLSIGVVLLESATSLPEILTAASCRRDECTGSCGRGSVGKQHGKHADSIVDLMHRQKRHRGSAAVSRFGALSSASACRRSRW